MKRFCLDRADLFLVVAAAPLLLFPRGPLPWIGLGLLLASWIWRGLMTRRWFTRTPLDRPLLVIFLMAIVSLYPSIDHGLSLPKLYGILLGISVYYSTASNVSSNTHFKLGVGLLTASIIAISLIGMVSTEWLTFKYPVLGRVYETIPRLVTGVQTSFGSTTGIHANELGGTLAFLIPLPFALAIGGRLPRFERIALTGTTLLGILALLLTASRSSFVGLSIAILALVAWRWPRARLALLAIIIAAISVAIAVDSQAIMEFLFRVDATSIASEEARSLPSRFEMWGRTRYMIEDFPFTGIGLNNFPIVLRTLYPSLTSGADTFIPHAHNIFLQTTVDLGLGGLLGFLGLWACLLYAGWQAHKRSPASDSSRTAISEHFSQSKLLQAAIAGLLAGLLSYLIFGLTDAITLGAKPTILLWLMMGLIVAAARLAGQSERAAAQSAAQSPQGSSPGDSPLGVGPPHCTRFSQLQTPEIQTDTRGVQPPFPIAESLLNNRVVAFAMATVGDAYWAITFFLVGMGYLVVLLGISGWMP